VTTEELNEVLQCLNQEDSGRSYCWSFNMGFICSAARPAGKTTNRTYLL